MIHTTLRAGLPAVLALLSLRALAAPVDPATLARITDEGFNHGQVVETAEYLADRIGGRLTNSPAMRTAESWTMGRFTAWGLKNVHREGFEFGRGWWIESSQVRMTAPRALVLRAIPIAWTPPTTGTLSAEVIVAPIKKERDFADWKGKLAGKIVLVSWPEPPKDETESPTKRLADPEIGKLDEFKIPHFEPDANKRVIEYFSFGAKLDAFLAQEGALAWARMSRREGHIVHGEGYMFRTGGSPRLPAVEIAAEDYRKLTRLAKGGPVTLAIDNVVHYEDADSKAYNIVAEIPGRDPKAGFVMAGAHLDSWVAGDGAADNGAGSAVILEASRILASLGVQPRRTLRFVLWSGEEEGLWGSGAYLEQHLARRPVGNPELAAMGPYFAEKTTPCRHCPNSMPWPPTSISTTAPARSVASTPKAIWPWCPRSRSGWRPSPAWARGPSFPSPLAVRTTCFSAAWDCRPFSSCRTRSITSRACIIPNSTSSITSGRRTCGRPR